MSPVLYSGTQTVKVTFRNRLCCRLESSPICVFVHHSETSYRVNWLVVLLATSTIDLYINARRHFEWTLILAGTSDLRKVKTYIKHGFEHCLGVRAWSIGTCCSSRLNIMTLTELIHTLKHTDSPSVSPASSTSRLWRTMSYLPAFTIRHLSPLLGLRRTPQTSCTSVRLCHWQRPEIHPRLWKDEAERGDRYICCGRGVIWADQPSSLV